MSEQTSCDEGSRKKMRRIKKLPKGMEMPLEEMLEISAKKRREKN